MKNKRMTLSLMALVGSVFLFVFASFAWLQVSQIVDIFGITGNLNNIESAANLQVSEDGVNYVDAESIMIHSAVPGDTFYFQVTIENTGDIDIHAKVLMFGFTNGVADVNGDDTNYLAGMSLVDVVRLSASNTGNAEVITDEYLVDLMPGVLDDDYTNAYVTLANSIDLGVGQSAVVTFSLTVDGSLAGNDYQNLMLTISNLLVQSVSAQ